MTERSERQTTAWDGAAVYGPAAGVILRTIADTSLLVPIQGDLADLRQIYALHGIGPCIWQHLDGTRTLDDVLEVVLGRYEVNADAARADIGELVGSLTNSKLIERRG